MPPTHCPSAPRRPVDRHRGTAPPRATTQPRPRSADGSAPGRPVALWRQSCTETRLKTPRPPLAGGKWWECPAHLHTLPHFAPRTQYSLPPAHLLPLYPRLYPPVLHKPWINRGQAVGDIG